MWLEKSYNRIIVLLLTICILNSCGPYYQSVALDEDQSFPQGQEPVIIYGLDTELIINNVEILNNQLNGSVISEISSRIKSNTKMRIYLKKTFTLPEPTDGKIIIPLNEIEKVEVKDHAKSTIFTVLGIIGFSLLALGIVMAVSLSQGSYR
jgi:hypothetical protein